MMNVISEDYVLTFVPCETDPDWILVDGDTASIEVFLNGLILAGTEEVEGLPTGVVVSPSLRVRRGTVALWMQFECLNYL